MDINSIKIFFFLIYLFSFLIIVNRFFLLINLKAHKSILKKIADKKNLEVEILKFSLHNILQPKVQIAILYIKEKRLSFYSNGKFFICELNLNANEKYKLKIHKEQNENNSFVSDKHVFYGNLNYNFDKGVFEDIFNKEFLDEFISLFTVNMISIISVKKKYSHTNKMDIIDSNTSMVMQYKLYESTFFLQGFDERYINSYYKKLDFIYRFSELIDSDYQEKIALSKI